MGTADGRWAIYFAPPPETTLWRLGCRWLGRDPESGARFPAPAGFAADEHDALTATPRRYGLHATLKAPFTLAPGTDRALIHRRLAAFAAAHGPVSAPPLRLARIGAFLALVPAAPSPALEQLAAACVRGLDDLRAPPAAAELERHDHPGLSDEQRALLHRWGYPYCLSAFRFHITLTSDLGDHPAGALIRHLRQWFAPVLAADAFRIGHVALFHEAGPGADFRLLARYPLSGAGDTPS